MADIEPSTNPLSDGFSRREMLAGTLAAYALSSTSIADAADALASSGMSSGPHWDLTALFANDAKWEEEAHALEHRISSLEVVRQSFSHDPRLLGQAFAAVTERRREVARLVVYAKLKAAENLRSAPALSRRQRAFALQALVDEKAAWLEPAVISIGRERAIAILAGHPQNEAFMFPTEEIFRRARHALPAQEEAALASANVLFDGPQSTYNQIIGSDMPHPRVTLSNGNVVTLDDPGYARVRGVGPRCDRKKVFDLFWSSYGNFQNSIGASLGTQAGAANFIARLRGFPSALEAALQTAAMPRAVFDTLIAETRRALPLHQRYLEFRRRALGLPDLHYYDLYAPLGVSRRSFDPASKRDLMLRAVMPLGKDYFTRLSIVSRAAWADMSSRPGRYAGAFTNGDAYDVHPYLLLSPADDYRSLTEYVHEWGHAMHSVLANAAQPYATAGYETFVAEIASTTNELLLASSMRSQAHSRQERLYVLGQELELLRLNMFREPMLGLRLVHSQKAMAVASATAERKLAASLS